MDNSFGARVAFIKRSAACVCSKEIIDIDLCFLSCVLKIFVSSLYVYDFFFTGTS